MCICRNYLDYVEESVADWTKEEEAKYQAHLLSKEIQRMREEEEMASRAAEKRQKSGKRGSSKSTTGDFLPFSRGRIPIPFPIKNSHLFPNTMCIFPIKKSKKKKKKKINKFIETTITYEKQ